MPLRFCASSALLLCTFAALRFSASALLRIYASAPLRFCSIAPLRLCVSAPLWLCVSAPHCGPHVPALKGVLLLVLQLPTPNSPTSPPPPLRFAITLRPLLPTVCSGLFRAPQPRAVRLLPPLPPSLVGPMSLPLKVC